MSILTKDIEDQALGLSAVDRVSLAEKLLASLDSPSQSALDQRWADEAEDRMKAFNRGEIGSSEASEVFERVEKKYGK